MQSRHECVTPSVKNGSNHARPAGPPSNTAMSRRTAGRNWRDDGLLERLRESRRGLPERTAADDDRLRVIVVEALGYRFREARRCKRAGSAVSATGSPGVSRMPVNRCRSSRSRARSVMGSARSGVTVATPNWRPPAAASIIAASQMPTAGMDNDPLQPLQAGIPEGADDDARHPVRFPHADLDDLVGCCRERRRRRDHRRAACGRRADDDDVVGNAGARDGDHHRRRVGGGVGIDQQDFLQREASSGSWRNTPAGGSSYAIFILYFK